MNFKIKLIKCILCGKEVERTATNQRFCIDCRELRDYYRHFCANKPPKSYNHWDAIPHKVDGVHKVTYVIKRPRPEDGCCEICKLKKWLFYHHWGEIKRHKFLPGIWCCKKCHDVAETVDHPEHFNSMSQLYITLKEGILSAATNTK